MCAKWWKELKYENCTNHITIQRDFRAIYECEHCGHRHEASGYDDSHFHQTVIPDMKCPQCDQTASADYRPLAPKYSDDTTV